MTLKISVIMAVYNCEKTVYEAVLSIINQTYKNIEIIICDDGSTDNTSEILEKLQCEYSFITVLKNKENEGIAKSENRCLSKAFGDFVAVMDGDDIAVNIRFEEELEFLLNNPQYDFVSGGMQCFNENGVFATMFSKPEPTLSDLYKKGGGFCHSAAMFRADVIKSAGYNEDDVFERREDYELWIRLYRLGYRGYNLNRVFHLYRKDDESYNKHRFCDKLRLIKKNMKVQKQLDLPKCCWFDIVKSLIRLFIPNSLYANIHRAYIKHRIKDKNKGDD